MSSTETMQSRRTPAAPGNGSILGLVAGLGKLPGILARSAKENGYQVIALCLSEEAEARVQPHCLKTFQVAPGQLGKNLKLLQRENVKQLVFVGKVPKLDILKNITKFDWTAVRELSRLSDFNDDTIQSAMGDYAASQGITVRSQAEFLTELFPDIGVLTARRPTAEEYADINFGKRIAKEIARQDIGQTVIVRNQMIMAIEAIEGTDKAIQRAVGLAKGPVVVVKVSKPNQDQRFDIPTVGMNTLNSMLAPKPGGVLAIEANETMVVEREEMIEFCNQHGICMVAI
ncbi:MAG: UDP-2,3-diacylglucosamine diphosphatase LpxI [Candidatus Obscuribacterales bacterium]|nr:UDP-2,3-diacylglucosamine diphosphatase LpxI [Candidatus Obscuribacterales bacterium]